jgi:hypothetical protein
MTSKLSKTIMFALAVVLVAAPLVFAQQSGSSSSGMGTGAAGPSDRPGTGSSMSGSGATGSSPTGTPSSSMGTMGTQDAIHATVDDVNHQKHTVKLRMQGGETVELKVPEQSLTSLSKGDSVQVSIHKADVQSGMPGTQQSRPESGHTGSPGSTGNTRSR